MILDEHGRRIVVKLGRRDWEYSHQGKVVRPFKVF